MKPFFPSITIESLINPIIDSGYSKHFIVSDKLSLCYSLAKGWRIVDLTTNVHTSMVDWNGE